MRGINTGIIRSLLSRTALNGNNYVSGTIPTSYFLRIMLRQGTLLRLQMEYCLMLNQVSSTVNDITNQLDYINLARSN